MKLHFLINLAFVLFVFIAPGAVNAQVINVDMDDADIIDLGFPDSERPKVPNAATKVLTHRKPLDAKFDFNRKVNFSLTGNGKTFNSWFYLHLQEGYSMMDMAALKQMPMGSDSGFGGDMVQIVDPDYVMYTYISTPDGKFAMKAGDEGIAVGTDLYSQYMADLFFNNFKKTGNVFQAGKDGVPFKRVEYKGTIDGVATTVWLSDARDVLLDYKNMRTLTGHMGIGYIANAQGKTYLVSGVESEGMKILVTGISKENKSFSGAGYQGIGDMMKGSMPDKSDAMAAYREEFQNALAEEDDPKIRELMMQNMAQNEQMLENILDGYDKFGETSNVSNLHSGNYEDEYYNNMLASLKIEYREYELSLQQDQSPGGIQLIKCLMGCNLIQQNRVERLQNGTQAIRNQYPNDTEKADELVSSYVEGVMMEATTNPCICGE